MPDSMWNRPAKLFAVVGGFAAACALLGAAAPVPAVGRVPGRIHHLNGATMRPFMKWAVEGTGGLLEPGRMVAHLLLIETTGGLVLVDSGLGTRDISTPDDRLPARWQWLARPVLDMSETAVRRVEKLGFKASDVTDVVLSHLDLDHAGGISDFPGARVHVSATEEAIAVGGPGTRYKPAMWAHSPRWAPHELTGQKWFGFPSARLLEGVEPEIRMVALPGHSQGHCGVAIKTSGSWLLHAGDAYFNRGEIHEAERSCPVGLEFFQAALQVDSKTRLGTQNRLRRLAREYAADVRIFSAHDPAELDAFDRRGS